MEAIKKINHLYSELATLTRLELKSLQNIVLYLKEEDEDLDSDIIYNLPRTYDVDKYGTYTEYAITGVQKDGEGEVLIDAISLGDDFGANRIFGEYELDTLQIMEILNYINLKMGTSPTN